MADAVRRQDAEFDSDVEAREWRRYELAAAARAAANLRPMSMIVPVNARGLDRAIYTTIGCHDEEHFIDAWQGDELDLWQTLIAGSATRSSAFQVSFDYPNSQDALKELSKKQLKLLIIWTRASGPILRQFGNWTDLSSGTLDIRALSQMPKEFSESGYFLKQHQFIRYPGYVIAETLSKKTTRVSEWGWRYRGAREYLREIERLKRDDTPESRSQVEAEEKSKREYCSEYHLNIADRILKHYSLIIPDLTKHLLKNQIIIEEYQEYIDSPESYDVKLVNMQRTDDFEERRDLLRKAFETISKLPNGEVSRVLSTAGKKLEKWDGVPHRAPELYRSRPAHEDVPTFLRRAYGERDLLNGVLNTAHLEVLDKPLADAVRAYIGHHGELPSDINLPLVVSRKRGTPRKTKRSTDAKRPRP